MSVFILVYFKEKLTRQNFSKNPKKPLCSNFSKNEFSWKKGLCQFLIISIILPVRQNSGKTKLNFQRPQSRKLFSGWFINAVHLAHAPIIAEQNDLQRVLYPLSVLAAPSTDRLTFIV